MANFTYSIIGGREVARKLDTLAGITKKEAKAVANAVLDFYFSVMPDYPAEPPGSKYSRTFQLYWGTRTRDAPMSLSQIKSVSGGNWDIQVGASGYAPYVVGYAYQQAKVHKGRWWRLSDVVKQNVSGARHVVDLMFNRFLQQAGFGM